MRVQSAPTRGGDVLFSRIAKPATIPQSRKIRKRYLMRFDAIRETACVTIYDRPIRLAKSHTVGKLRQQQRHKLLHFISW